MKLIDPKANRICQENEIYESELSLDGKKVLELGCGKAYLSRAIATTGNDRQLVAMEVDKIQHEKNLQIDDLPNVRFELAGAENIPQADNCFDVVFMFKSLHHVPMELMDSALDEIHRVLKPGGLAYISEPVFDGDFNQLIRLFHDEEHVRKAAFNAIKKAVDKGNFESQQQIFFSTPRHYENFEDFENRIIKVTHTDHQLSDELMTTVESRFAKFAHPDGSADFDTPIRVDLIKKI